VKNLPLLLFLPIAPLAAQAPRAEPVDGILQADAANDFFQRARNLYDSAQKATDLENRQALYLRSSELFSLYLEQFPDHPNAEASWWYLGSSYYKAGMIDEAKRCFATLLNRYGKGVWAAAAAYTLAADHYNKAEYAFAAPMFERYAANAAKPEERPRGHFFAGNCHRFLGRDAEAAAQYRKVLEDPAGSLFAGQAKLALGHLANRGERPEEALDWFEQAMTGPYAVKVLGEGTLNAGLTATRLGDTAKAEILLRRVLGNRDMADFHADAQTALMANHFQKAEYAKVIEIFRASPVKATGEKEAARQMYAARSYMRLKRPSEALNHFREVEKLVKPETDTAFQASYYRLLCFYQIEGRHVPDQVDAFLQLYRKARPEDARIHTALMMKAESLFSDKKIDEAAKVYAEVNAKLVSDKNRPGLLYQRGWCMAEAGDHQGAIRSLGEFIQAYPDDDRVPSAVAKRAVAYARSSEKTKALADFNRLTESKDKDLVAFGWLEAARLHREAGEIPEMIERYRGLLATGQELGLSLAAEAEYWIGWGHVKSNRPADSVEHLEKARELRPEAYQKHAGQLLALGYFASQNPVKLSAELHRAIEGKYIDEVPRQAVQWCGMQAFNAEDYPSAARFLAIVANPDEPRETPKEVWRYLAKAALETGDAEKALEATGHLLAVEENPAWKADGLLDRARALFALNRAEEARVTSDEAMALRPQGRTLAMLRILTGDIELKAGDASKAAAEYLIVLGFNDDKEIQPLALWKVAQAFEAQKNTAEAEKYRSQLATRFPQWQPPAP
jgi:tetratricopeptide (TPR) repeat protein